METFPGSSFPRKKPENKGNLTSLEIEETQAKIDRIRENKLGDRFGSPGLSDAIQKAIKAAEDETIH